MPFILKGRVEVGELVWEDIGVGDKVKSFFAELFLHFKNVETQLVFSSHLKGVREMIDSLVLIQTLVEILLGTGTQPHYIPIMRVCVTKPDILQNTSHKSRVGLENLV